MSRLWKNAEDLLLADGHLSLYGKLMVVLVAVATVLYVVQGVTWLIDRIVT